MHVLVSFTQDTSGCACMLSLDREVLPHHWKIVVVMVRVIQLFQVFMDKMNNVVHFSHRLVAIHPNILYKCEQNVQYLWVSITRCTDILYSNSLRQRIREVSPSGIKKKCSIQTLLTTGKCALWVLFCASAAFKLQQKGCSPEEVFVFATNSYAHIWWKKKKKNRTSNLHTSGTHQARWQ